ncbi:hypothetical protein EW026_g7212 [Hermanssonia centrifuga]|uniref:Uncharacterized protein n=1 Tax=Hermanssonia centrifuga TaxID=98765 RepID=A0A4S4KD05_9APHY|nr:hypothetical protein EW026_g7212 [Hermanssonia centrifuga]
MPPRNQRKPPLLAPPPRMQTRHGNKDAHPGQPDLPQSRRSSAVVQAKKSVKAHQEAIQRADQNQRMQAVADIEDLQDREDVEADHVANRPPPPADLLPRTKRNIAPLKNKISATEEHAQLPVKSEDSSDEYDPDTEGSDEDLVDAPKKARSGAAVALGGILKGWKPSSGSSIPPRGALRASSTASMPPDSSDAADGSDDVGIHLSSFADEDDEIERQDLTMGSNVDLQWDVPVPYVSRKTQKQDAIQLGTRVAYVGSSAIDTAASDLNIRDLESTEHIDGNLAANQQTASTRNSNPRIPTIALTQVHIMKPRLSVTLKSARDREKVTINSQVPSIDKGKASVAQVVGGKATIEGKNTASRRQRFKMRDLPEGMERSFSYQRSENSLGRLRSDVILFTFYWHLQSIQGVGLFDDNNDAPPIGAYTLSIQAVERAFKAHVTGEKVLPTGQVAWFSVDNWGDTYKYLGGRKVKSPKASKFSKTIQAFTVQDWETILTDACALRTGFKMEGKKRKVASSTGSAYNSDDVESGPEYDVMVSD